jgi:hypothetical protein
MPSVAHREAIGGHLWKDGHRSAQQRHAARLLNGTIVSDNFGVSEKKSLVY